MYSKVKQKGNLRNVKLCMYVFNVSLNYMLSNEVSHIFMASYNYNAIWDAIICELKTKTERKRGGK